MALNCFRHGMRERHVLKEGNYADYCFGSFNDYYILKILDFDS